MLTSTPLLHSACKLYPYGNNGWLIEQPTSSQLSISSTNARHRKHVKNPLYHPSRDLPTCTTARYCHVNIKRKTHEMGGDACSRPRCISAEEASSYTMNTHQTLLHAPRDKSIDDGASKPNPPQHTPQKRRGCRGSNTTADIWRPEEKE